MSNSNVAIQLTADIVLLPDATRATARARREERRRATSRSQSRGRAVARTVSPLGSTVAPLASSSNSATRSASLAPSARGESPERGRQQLIEEEEEDLTPPPTAFIRGLLTLTLTKPTKIRKINLRFKGVARSDWPEGVLIAALLRVNLIWL